MCQRCALGYVTLLNVRVLDYLACPNCGAPRLRRLGKCCNVVCRVALHRWRKAQYHAAQKARRPVVRIGRRSTLALRSPNLPHGEIIED